jgi:hypothetical protein
MRRRVDGRQSAAGVLDQRFQMSPQRRHFVDALPVNRRWSCMDVTHAQQ